MISKINQKLHKLFINSQSAINDALANELPVNVFLIDENGYIAWGNKRMLSTLCLTSLDDFIGKHVSLWDEERWILCKDIINSGVEQATEESTKDKFYLTTRKPIFDNKSNVIGVIGVSLDITEQKQAELAKKEFIENMSHDLRTPFAGILSLTEYLHSKEEDLIKKEFLGEIMKSGKWLLTLLNQVLEMSMLGSHPLILKDFSLSDIVHQVAELLQAEVRHKGLEMNISCPEITIHSDQMRVTRILLNLIGNAVKYTEKGAINVKVGTHSPLQISVEDTGKGIPVDGLETIFNRFTKLRPSYEQQGFSGAGVGLHIAREFARELGGDITVTSEVGKGSCFTLLLKN